MKTTYEIPIDYVSTKVITVEAENLQEACELACRKFLSEDDEYFLPDSMQIDQISLEDRTGEKLDITKVYDKL